MTRPCICQHDADLHDHYRKGGDCGACQCNAYEAPVRGIIVDGLLFVALLAAVVFIVVSCWQASGYAATRHCETRACMRRALVWQRHENQTLRRQLRAHWEPTRQTLICPIATAFGVSCAEARRGNRCESNTDRIVSNSSSHVGWFQESSTFMSDNRLPFSNRQRWNPVVNVLAAILVVRHEGWRQWSCKP